MADLNTVFNSVSKNNDVAGKEDTVRSIANSPLASGVPVGVGTSLLPGATQRQTTRLFGGSDNAITGGNQGDRAQVPPATDNKIPRIYGQVTTGGVVTDAYKSSANTVFVCFTLSETNPDRYDYYFDNTLIVKPAWTLHAVYRDNKECYLPAISTPPGGVANQSTVRTLVDLDGVTANIDIYSANVINVWGWAGNSDVQNQFFPKWNSSAERTTYGKNAYDVFPTWDANVTMQNTVFMIVEVDRLNEDIDPSAPTEIDEVGEFRFTIESDGFLNNDGVPPTEQPIPLHNPAVALQDYLLDSVYGCGLSNVDIDLNSFDEWQTYCEQNMYYASYNLIPGGTSVTFPGGESGYINTAPNKRRVDAFINTQSPVVENIEKITQAGDATLTYDTKQGKFKVLVNKILSDTDRANAFLFDNTNIISSIAVNSTDLYSLFNFAEVSFPNYRQLDRSDNLIVEIPLADRVTNEPTSGTNYNIPAITDRFRAADMANISLKQSRINNTISFTGDHSSMGVATGDYVKITNSGKGFDEKIARVMRVNEREDDNGTLIFDYVCIEYSDEPYEEFIYLDTTDDPTSGSVGSVENYTQRSGLLDNTDFFETYIVPFGYQPSGIVETGNIYIVNETDTGNGNVYNYEGNLLQSNVDAGSLRFQTLVPVSVDATNNPWLAIKGYANIAGEGSIATEWDTQLISMTYGYVDGDSPALNTVSVEYNLPGTDSTSYGWFPLNKLTSGPYYITVQYENADRYPARRSIANYTGYINLTDLDCDTPNLVTLNDIYYGRGTRLWDQFGALNRTSNQTSWAKIYPRQYDVCNIASAQFEVSTNLLVNWTSGTSTSRLGLLPTANITFESKSNIESQTFTLPLAGIDLIDNATGGDVSTVKNKWVNNTSTISTVASDYGLDHNWYPARLRTDLLTQHTSFTGLTFNGAILFTHKPHNYRYKP